MSQKEILTINVGQGGINLGHALVKQYCHEHAICKSGKYDPKYISKNDSKYNHSITSMFEETKHDTLITRSVLVDSEPDVIDEIKSSDYYNLYNSNLFLCGKENVGSNFARGYHSIGAEMIDKITDKIRTLSENCNNLQGFFINHATGGGTGSGLGSLILEKISTNYNKKSIVCTQYIYCRYLLSYITTPIYQ